MIHLTVDNKSISTKEGTTLLQTCLKNNIYIPNLCFMDTMEHPPASCRLCFIEIEGTEGPQPACTVVAEEGMVVKTDTSAVRHLQRSALQLLLSAHDVDCGNCAANKRCELQRMAAFLKVGLKAKRLERFMKEEGGHDEHPLLKYYPNRCVLCGKCVHICQLRRDRPLMTFAKRGIETVISFYGDDVTESPCLVCNACIDICPVAAIVLK
jgi:NADH dehydrogenase/NADH:ubiquinone oxidoreductase subunit G